MLEEECMTVYCTPNIDENGNIIVDYDFYMPNKKYALGEIFENQNVRYQVLSIGDTSIQ